MPTETLAIDIEAGGQPEVETSLKVNLELEELRAIKGLLYSIDFSLKMICAEIHDGVVSGDDARYPTLAESAQDGTEPG